MLTRSFVALSLRITRNLLLAVAAICMFAAPLYAAANKQGYQSFIVGNPADAQPSQHLSPGLVLMGGGTDVDAAFQWMCERAGGGDFVVIRTTGTDAYNPYIQQPRSFRPLLHLFCVALAVRRTLLFWMRVYFLGIAGQYSVRLHVTSLLRPQAPAVALRSRLVRCPVRPLAFAPSAFQRLLFSQGRSHSPTGRAGALFAAASRYSCWSRFLLFSRRPYQGLLLPLLLSAEGCSARSTNLQGMSWPGALSRAGYALPMSGMEPAGGSSQLTC